MIPAEFALGVPPSRKVIQIAVTDPGYEAWVLYNTGEVWRWFWKNDDQGYRRVWEKVETP